MKLVVDFVDSEFEEYELIFDEVFEGFFERVEIISSSLVSPSMIKIIRMMYRVFGLLVSNE